MSGPPAAETPSAPTPAPPAAVPANATVDLAKMHLRFGWWTLLVFLSLGLVLEGLHAWKLPWYLDVRNETRRLMFTLAHAHGTLLSLINIGLGCTLLTLYPPGKWTAVSRCLTASSLLIPTGFILGGVVIHAGDPGIGILLLPVGAFLLIAAVFMAARRISALK